MEFSFPFLGVLFGVNIIKALVEEQVSNEAIMRSTESIFLYFPWQADHLVEFSRLYGQVFNLVFVLFK